VGLLDKALNVAKKVGTTIVKNTGPGIIVRALVKSNEVVNKAIFGPGQAVPKATPPVSSILKSNKTQSKVYALNTPMTNTLTSAIKRTVAKKGSAAEAAEDRRLEALDGLVGGQTPVKAGGVIKSVTDVITKGTSYVKANPAKSAALAAGGVAGAVGLGFAIESAAEALGVRGGAGFIGAAGVPAQAQPIQSSKKKKRRSKKRTTIKKKKKTSHSRKRSSTKRRKKKSSFGTAKQYKRKGGKAVHYTKTGQPYIILKSGKARFIKR